jgi:prolyl-tRNA synthetase
VRISNTLYSTLKESPHDAEIMSHKLMMRAGLIRKLGSGLYTWLPMGLRVLRKVEAIIREEMQKVGAQEILMPVVQPAELWQETERWDAYGPLLLKMQDRQKRSFCIGPTHEEVITDLMRRELKSYKQLPSILYQIQVKFRDEIRPRFGVMRAREFMMKDAYSFDLSMQDLEKTYHRMHQAYHSIFERLGLRFRAVLADSGNIGGSVSHEFHVLADSGEDLLAYSDASDYAANVEQATRLISTDPRPAPSQALNRSTFAKESDSDLIKSVEEQTAYFGIAPKAMLKTIVVQGKTAQHPFVALLVRGDHQINPLKAEKHALIASPFTMAELEDLKGIADCKPGFVGPINLRIPQIADHDVAGMSDFCCGANANGSHYHGVNWDRDCKLPELMDLRSVQEGDPSPDGSGHLHFTRGIEVGHIFQLGQKYSEPMKASVLDTQGKAQYLNMGCYGIGVSRIVGAAIEQNHDARGIVWPTALAPFQVILLPIQYYRSQTVQAATDALYQSLMDSGIEVLLDDREERLGVMLADSELIGIPHQIIIADKTLSEGAVEYKGRRDALSAVQRLAPTEVLAFLRDMLYIHLSS